MSTLYYTSTRPEQRLTSVQELQDGGIYTYNPPLFFKPYAHQPGTQESTTSIHHEGVRYPASALRLFFDYGVWPDQPDAAPIFWGLARGHQSQLCDYALLSPDLMFPASLPRSLHILRGPTPGQVFFGYPSPTRIQDLRPLPNNWEDLVQADLPRAQEALIHLFRSLRKGDPQEFARLSSLLGIPNQARPWWSVFTADNRSARTHDWDALPIPKEIVPIIPLGGLENPPPPPSQAAQKKRRGRPKKSQGMTIEYRYDEYGNPVGAYDKRGNLIMAALESDKIYPTEEDLDGNA
ncbi:MAG: hypothetical protein EOM21_15925 [Gammaproteobacteria bacterium]|nr:hypothetical protein [Gammaproteobacteria bacterium]